MAAFLAETMPPVSGYFKRYSHTSLLTDWGNLFGIKVCFEYEADRIAFLLRWGDL